MEYPKLEYLDGKMWYKGVKLMDNPWFIPSNKKGRRNHYMMCAYKLIEDDPARLNNLPFKELYPYLAKEMGISLSNFCSVWNALIYKNFIAPIEHLAKMIGHHKGIYQPHLIRLINTHLEVFEQAYKDGNKHIMPIMMLHAANSESDISPEHLKQVYGKGRWKTICKNSYSRNYLFFYHTESRYFTYKDVTLSKDNLTLPTSGIKWLLRKEPTFSKWYIDYKQIPWKNVTEANIIQINSLFRDTHIMATQLDKPFKLSWNIEEMKSKHDEYTKEINLIEDRDYYTPFQSLSILEGITFPEGVTLLNTPALLHKEGKDMGHCVYSYVNKVKYEGSIIFGIETEEGRSTCEISNTLTNIHFTGYGSNMDVSLTKGKYAINQHKGKYNNSPPNKNQEIATRLNKILNEKLNNEKDISKPRIDQETKAA